MQVGNKWHRSFWEDDIRMINHVSFIWACSAVPLGISFAQPASTPSPLYISIFFNQIRFALLQWCWKWRCLKCEHAYKEGEHRKLRTKWQSESQCLRKPLASLRGIGGFDQRYKWSGTNIWYGFRIDGSFSLRLGPASCNKVPQQTHNVFRTSLRRQTSRRSPNDVVWLLGMHYIHTTTSLFISSF